MAAAAIAHKDVDLAALGVDRAFIFVGRLGVFGDDVPGVDEAGELLETVLAGGVGGDKGEGTYVAKTAEEDVDDGIGRADTAFYPDCRHRVRESAILDQML